MKIRNLPIVLAALLALAVLAVGYDGSQATGATKTGTSAHPSAGSAINIGVIATESGPQASSTSQAATVGPAWGQYINKTLGGISGREVRVTVEDDKGDPATAQSVAKDLIDNKKVVAIVVSSDNLVSTYDDYAISKGVPLISGTDYSEDWNTKGGMFPTPTDALSGLTAQVSVAKKYAHATKFANIYCSEVAACSLSDPLLKADAAKAGMGYTALSISSTAPSYTAECLKLQQRVDYIELNVADSAGAGFIQDYLSSYGVRPTSGEVRLCLHVWQGRDDLAAPRSFPARFVPCTRGARGLSVAQGP